MTFLIRTEWEEKSVARMQADLGSHKLNLRNYHFKNVTSNGKQRVEISIASIEDIVNLSRECGFDVLVKSSNENGLRELVICND